MFEYFESFLSKYQCGFREGFSVQHCLLSMLEKWKSAIDNRNTFGALLTHLSKAFCCLWLDLLIAKVNANWFSITALRLVQIYLSNPKQGTEINSDFSFCRNFISGTSGVHIRTIVIPYFPVWFIFHNEKDWFWKLRRP